MKFMVLMDFLVRFGFVLLLFAFSVIIQNTFTLEKLNQVRQQEMRVTHSPIAAN